MAQLNVGSNSARRDRKRMNLRVDFTPMVDMNMLLITFFMFCTTLTIPQVMDVVLPTKDSQGSTTEVPHSRTVTFLLGEDDKVYYYAGLPDYSNYDSLKEIDYSATGLRNVLLERNSSIISKSVDLKRKRMNKEISEKDFKLQMANLKKNEKGVIAIIKPTNQSSYKNLVDALDEMQVCSVSQYAIVEPQESDNFLLQNYKAKGKLSDNANM